MSLSSSSSSRNLDSIQKQQDEYARRLYRQQQLDMMEAIASGRVDSEGRGGAASSISGAGESFSSGVFPADDLPVGALESARRFLWEDEEDNGDECSPNEELVSVSETSHCSSKTIKSSRSIGSRNTWGSGIADAVKKTLRPSSSTKDDDYLDDDSEQFYRRNSNLAPGGSGARGAYPSKFYDAQPRESDTDTFSHETIKMRRLSFCATIHDFFMCVYHTAVGLVAITCEFVTSCLSFTNPRLLCLVPLLVLAFVFLCVSVVFYVNARAATATTTTATNGSNSIEAGPGVNVTNPTDLKPVQDNFVPDDLPPIQAKARFGELRQVIVDSSFTDESTLDRPGSAQNYALRWLTDEDTRQVSIMDPAMLQRYALASLYYSTYVYSETINTQDRGAKSAVLYSLYWTNMTNWLSEHGICTWEGVSCQGDSDGNVAYDGDGLVVSLNLPDNQLRGTIPSELAALSKLETLVLTENLLSGSIPERLGEDAGSPMPLQTLRLSGNQLTGTLPTELGNLHSMTDLSLDKNDIMGTFPTEYAHMTDLRILDLTENLIKGSIPEWLWTSCTNLEVIHLDGNAFDGTLSSNIQQLTNLVEFRATGNRLAGILPESIRELKNLQILHLDYNLFTGRIPLDWGTLLLLEEMKLNGNQLTDSLPSAIHKLTKLRILDVNSNQLRGTVPSEFSQLPAVTAMYLQSNQFEGAIPSEIGALDTLVDLRLSDNLLTGSIPSQLGGLSSLEQLECYGNTLTGLIPSELGSLERLTTVKLQNNDLTGSVPTELCKLETNFLGYIATDCNESAGGFVSCDCCSACFPS